MPVPQVDSKFLGVERAPTLREQHVDVETAYGILRIPYWTPFDFGDATLCALQNTDVVARTCHSHRRIEVRGGITEG